MAVSPTSNMTYNRISGLASGIDTEGLVKKLMSTQSLAMNKLIQKQQLTQWKGEALRAANTKLLDFRGALDKLKLESTFNQKTITSSDPSKVEITKTGIPSQDSYTITDVTLPVIGNPASAKFSTSVTSTAEIGSDFSFQVNGQAISVAKTDTISSVISQINSKSASTGVKATYFDGDKSITFVSTVQDANAEINITNVAGANPLGLSNGTISDTQNDFGSTAKAGKSTIAGSVTINGTQYDITSSTFTYDNMKITLKSEFASPQTVNTISSKDTEAAFTAIKTVVDKYNELIGSLNGLVTEKKYADYKPLLDEQKESMEEKEITMWETKAKSGQLRGDSTLSTVLTSMRSSLYSSVQGVSNKDVDTLAEIGITTSEEYTDRGKLVLDEDKLRSMLSSNPDDVQALFTKTFDTGKATDNTSNNSSKHAQSGFAWRLYDTVNVAISNIIKTAGSTDVLTESSTLGKQFNDLADDILDWKSRLLDIENRHYKRFTAMETALNNLSSQSSWLAQQFAS